MAFCVIAPYKEASLGSWDLGTGGLKGKGTNRHRFVYLLKFKPMFLMVLDDSEVFFGTRAFQTWAEISSGKVQSRTHPHTQCHW